MAIVETISSSPQGARRLRLASPVSLEPIGEIEVTAATEVAAAVERARKAQPAWAALSHRERGRFLEAAARRLAQAPEPYVEQIETETGKPETEIYASELIPACDALRFYARRAGRLLADRTLPLHLMKTKKLRISYRPLGVVGIITPWNFPFLLSLNPSVQALAAGNAVLLKPSEVTPRSGGLVARLFEEVGLPEGLLQCLAGDGETGADLVEAGVDKISFTGSVASGQRVAEACGRRLVPCTLELGGKDPMLVCGDADLERAAAGAVYGAFANAGQVCTSTERVYVEDSVADAFVEKVLARTRELRQGPEGEADVGPAIHAPQLEVIERHVADAVAKGARVRAGGRRNPRYPGLYWEPTVLTEVTHQMDVMREETFGPVLPIMRVRNEEEAVAFANDSRYGLNASVWTRDKRKGVRIAKTLHSGGAVVNDTMLTYAVTESPFGGRKDSGIGQVNGEIGLKGYCHPQSILVDRFGSKSEFPWFPYGARKVRVLRRLMRLIWSSPLGRLVG